jgi:hypothetical protein
MPPLIYPAGDEQQTLNLGLATWGMDEILAQNMILIDTFAGTVSGGAVSSVFGRTGAVLAQSGDYAVAQVTGAAPLASPAFTGIPTAPTAIPGTNTTQLATTAFDTAAIAANGLGVQVATVTLTSTEIRAATSVQIIAAPAAGQIIVPVSLESHYSYGGTPYTLGAGSTTLSAFYTGVGTAVLTCATGLSGGSSNQFGASTAFEPTTALAAASIEATALNVNMNGTWNSGNGTILVVVRYYVVSF